MDKTEFLYKTRPGRLLLGILISRPVSVLAGIILDSRASKVLIDPFVRKNNINLWDYQTDNINSFNDFFCRRIKDGLRPIATEKNALISPCDAFLSAYKIDKGTVLSIKQSSFTIASLLRDKGLAKRFDGGYALVYRLCVNHYHRYVYFDSGKKYKNRKIRGVYHTVRPTALCERPVFIENSREYAVMGTDNFGLCVQMEVGAMMVGRIVNEHQEECRVERGAEKGHFEFGGSTVIVLLQKNRAHLREDIAQNLNNNVEIPVIMGEKIGQAAHR